MRSLIALLFLFQAAIAIGAPGDRYINNPNSGGKIIFRIGTVEVGEVTETGITLSEDTSVTSDTGPATFTVQSPDDNAAVSLRGDTGGTERRWDAKALSTGNFVISENGDTDRLIISEGGLVQMTSFAFKDETSIAAGTVTVDVTNKSRFVVPNQTTTINNFSGGVDGQVIEITLTSSGSVLNLVAGNSTGGDQMLLDGGAKTFTGYQTLRFQYRSSQLTWFLMNAEVDPSFESLTVSDPGRAIFSIRSDDDGTLRRWDWFVNETNGQLVLSEDGSTSRLTVDEGGEVNISTDLDVGVGISIPSDIWSADGNLAASYGLIYSGGSFGTSWNWNWYRTNTTPLYQTMNINSQTDAAAIHMDSNGIKFYVENAFTPGATIPQVAWQIDMATGDLNAQGTARDVRTNNGVVDAARFGDSGTAAIRFGTAGSTSTCDSICASFADCMCAASLHLNTDNAVACGSTGGVTKRCLCFCDEL